jgi:hypothetical protein
MENGQWEDDTEILPFEADWSEMGGWAIKKTYREVGAHNYQF